MREEQPLPYFNLRPIVTAIDNRLLRLIHEYSETRTRDELLGKLWFLYRFVKNNSLSESAKIIDAEEKTAHKPEDFMQTYMPAFQKVPYGLGLGAELAVRELYFRDCEHVGGSNNPDLVHPSGYFVEVKIRPSYDKRNPESILLRRVVWIRPLLEARKEIKFAFLHYGPGSCKIEIYDVEYGSEKSVDESVELPDFLPDREG